MKDPEADHDLLVEINSNLKFYTEQFHSHVKDDSSRFSILERDIKAAHRRMDWLTTSGIFAIVVLILTLWFKR